MIFVRNIFLLPRRELKMVYVVVFCSCFDKFNYEMLSIMISQTNVSPCSHVAASRLNETQRRDFCSWVFLCPHSIYLNYTVDLLVFCLIDSELLHRFKKKMFGWKLGKQTITYSLQNFNWYLKSTDHILFLRAMTGCDTGATIFKKGRTNVFKTLE